MDCTDKQCSEAVSHLKRAKVIQLFDRDRDKLEDFKGIANVDDEKEVFNVVKPGYEIVQHEDMVSGIYQALDELGEKYTMDIQEVGDKGARIHATVTFPDITTDIEYGGKKDPVCLQTDWDNSYDSTTGVRGSFGAFRLICTNGLTIGEKYANYYHRHTKGIDYREVKKTIMVGADVFKEKVVQKFNQWARETMTPIEMSAMLDLWIKEKFMAAKYLQHAQNLLQAGTSITQGNLDYNNKWLFYNLLTEVVTHTVKTIDTRRRYGTLVSQRFNSMQRAQNT